MVEFFKLFLAIFKILNKRVLDKKIRKSSEQRRPIQRPMWNMCVCVCSIHFFCGALTTVMWASASWRYEHRSCLILQGSHAFFQMELQSFIGLSEQTIHSVWQTLVVLLIHFLSLTSLMSREEENQTVRGMSASNFLFDTDSIWVYLKSWSSVSAWI